MPRTQLSAKPKSKRKSWAKANMIEAVKAVREKKIGLKKAVKLYSVPKTTLQRFVHSDQPSDEVVNTTIERKPVLPTYIEKSLVSYLLVMESKFYGLSRKDVRKMAYQLAVKNNIEHPFRNYIAGRAWLDLFLLRHKDKLSIRSPTGTSNARAQGFNKEAMDKFFDLLEEEFLKHNYPPERIFKVYYLASLGKTTLQHQATDNDPHLPSTSTHIAVQMTQPEFQPGPSGQANQSSPQVIDSNPVVLPQHILPVPTPKNKRSNRGRKSFGATLLTGSPYKQQLEKSITSIAQRGRTRGRGWGRARVSSGDTVVSENVIAHTQPTKQDDACSIFTLKITPTINRVKL